MTVDDTPVEVRGLEVGAARKRPKVMARTSSAAEGTLASNVAGSSGRLVRVARGRYVLVETRHG
jgi:hypothetical protein